MVNGWIVGVLGIWTFIVPFLSFAPIANSWNNWIVGVIVAIFGFTMARRAAWQGWISGIVAIWLFIAGFIPGLLAGPGVYWNDLIIGVVFAICGFAAVPARTTSTAGRPTTA